MPKYIQIMITAQSKFIQHELTMSHSMAQIDSNDLLKGVALLLVSNSYARGADIQVQEQEIQQSSAFLLACLR